MRTLYVALNKAGQPITYSSSITREGVIDNLVMRQWELTTGFIMGSMDAKQFENLRRLVLDANYEIVEYTQLPR